MMFSKLNTLLISLLSFLLICNVVFAEKFPQGYPECWKDTKNPVNTDFEEIDLTKNNLGQPNNIFCPINSKVGHKFFLVDFSFLFKIPKIS